jgi:rubrerythrin
MAAMTQDNDTQKILFDKAEEEKTHVGGFLNLLMKRDHGYTKR